MRLPEEMFIQSRIDDFLREAEHERLVRLVSVNPAELLRKYGEAIFGGKKDDDAGDEHTHISKN